MNCERSLEQVKRFFDSCEEWLAVDAAGKSFAVRRGEIEISETGGRIFLEFPGEKGFAVWRALGWKIEKSKITFDLNGRFGREKTRISFVPRISAAELSAAVDLARIEKAGKIAALMVSAEPNAKLVRVSLNKENGRLAQIVFENRAKKQTVALADVSDALSPERLLTTAILRLDRLRRRKKNPVSEIRLAAEEKTAKKLQKLCSLLSPINRSSVKISAIKASEIEKLPGLSFEEACTEKTRRFSAAGINEPSGAARRVMALAPAETDVVSSRSGETVRFRGLPFVRVRKLFGAEKAWFGIERERRLLTEENFSELTAFVEDLKAYRRFDSPNKRHEFYRLAPEAWLESVLRRDIRRLDANLILSPVYHQFRVASEKIDLLAARRDGRLVVVEVKTAPDREMVFQAADYWLEIESRRRAGAFQKNKIFGDVCVLDAPPLVYLVAPALSFHPDCSFFARTLDERMEIFRFDLNESWRENLKVLSRRGLTENL